MLALIMHGNTPVTYVRGSKAHVVNKAKELVSSLKQKDPNLPKTLTSYYSSTESFSFKILKSVDEIK